MIVQLQSTVVYVKRISSGDNFSNKKQIPLILQGNFLRLSACLNNQYLGTQLSLDEILSTGNILQFCSLNLQN